MKKMNSYKCKECNVVKDKDEYRPSTRHTKGFTSVCKECQSKKNKEARLRKNEVINKNIDMYLTVKMRNMRKYDRKFGVEVFTTPTLEELKELINSQNNKCCYTGVELQWRLDADMYTKGSFDRIDTKYGHEIDNLVVSSVHANMLRGPMSRNEFIKKISCHALDDVDDTMIVV